MAGKVPRDFGFTEEYLRSISPASVRAIGKDRGYGEAPFGSTSTVVNWFLECQAADGEISRLTSAPGEDFQDEAPKPVVTLDAEGNPSDGKKEELMELEEEESKEPK